MNDDKIVISDFNLLVKNDISHFAERNKSFMFDFLNEDFCFELNDEKAKIEAELMENTEYTLTKAKTKMLILLKELSEKLPYKNAFLLHSACFDVDGVGVAFAAQSGTGKSTHMLNWKELLGDKMTFVNGDKPIVRFFDRDFCDAKNLEIPEGTELGVPYAYGTPWRGKESLGANTRTILKHICFIERSETNFVTKISKEDAVSRIMKQVYMPKDPIALSKTLELINRLINSCELWIIHCNMEPESAEVAYKAIFGK